MRRNLKRALVKIVWIDKRKYFCELVSGCHEAGCCFYEIPEDLYSQEKFLTNPKVGDILEVIRDGNWKIVRKIIKDE
jgi:hypothetical protein